MTRNGNIRSTGQQCTPKAEEGYCNKATQSGPLTHSQNHQAQNMVEHTEVKERKARTKEEIRKVIWCYIYCKQHFTENYKKVYEIWRQQNPTCRMYVDAKKLTNQKNYIMKNNKITEMEIEEIKREIQTSQRSHPAEREEETLVHTDTIKDDEHKLNASTYGYHPGWWTQAECSDHNRRRSGNSTTKRTDYQIKRKKWKCVLSGDTNNYRQQAKTTETSKHV